MSSHQTNNHVAGPNFESDSLGYLFHIKKRDEGVITREQIAYF
jgi:hypothetical protein